MREGGRAGTLQDMFNKTKVKKSGWPRTVQGTRVEQSDIRLINRIDYFTKFGLAVCAWFDVPAIHLEAS